MERHAIDMPPGTDPYYVPARDEVHVFEEAHRRNLAVMLKGPTGCGKTRFVEYMAWRLQRPLITIACHDDMTASDLVGRFQPDDGSRSRAAPHPTQRADR